MISRRHFLRVMISFFLSVVCSFFLSRRVWSIKTNNYTGIPCLSVVKGKNVRMMLEEALKPLGGIGAFVRKGAKVALKPNAAWTRTPEQAANTSPELLRHTIALCYEAGAEHVSVVEHTCDNAHSALKVNGIGEVVKNAGAELVILGDKDLFVERAVPRGKRLKKVDVARHIIDADVFINMPIAKTHGSATLTLSMKNHMGVVRDRWYFHMNDLHQCIADVSTLLEPDLIIVDAMRIMTSNGPKGPGTVETPDLIIAGIDQVAVDAYAATLFGFTGQDIGHIAQAYAHGIGEIDLKKVTIITKDVA